jgi:hypothetical protein
MFATEFSVDAGADAGQNPAADQPADPGDGDEFMYEFLRAEMKRQRQQRRAMRREKDSRVEIVDRFRETERYRRELDEGTHTVTPEQAEADNVDLMPHFEGVELRDYRRVPGCERFDECERHRTSIRPGMREAAERMARDKALRQYRKVALGADMLIKHMQRKLEESAKRRKGGCAPRDEKKREDYDEVPMTTDSEDRLRDIMRQVRRDMSDVARNVEILDGQLALFNRARERLEFRYKAAVGTRPEFLNDILLMTGGRPAEPYIKSVGDLNEGDA